MTVAGKGIYTGTATKSFKITQVKNQAAAKKASVKKTFKASALKKKVRTITLPKVSTKFGKAKWKVTAKDKKKALSLSGSKVMVKKGTKKRVYTIKLRAYVAATKNYKAASTGVVIVRVTVK